jgi:hypothetical protein
MPAQCRSDHEAEFPALGSLGDDIAPTPTLSNFKIRLQFVFWQVAIVMSWLQLHLGRGLFSNNQSDRPWCN